MVVRLGSMVPERADSAVVDDLTALALTAARGDRVALAAFVRHTQPEVWRVCTRLSDHGEADDLTQEVYLRAIPALARFRGDSSARTWLLQIARHVCADDVRRRTRRRALVERITRRHVPGDADAQDRTGEIELDAAVAALGQERRAAFVLTQVAGLSYAEAAEVEGVPVGTIRSRVSRARSDLVDLLTEGVAGSSAS
jgi:RNA polymerase sigma-70 factor, ECF subfamily